MMYIYIHSLLPVKTPWVLLVTYTHIHTHIYIYTYNVQRLDRTLISVLRWTHCPICLLVFYVLLMPAIYVVAHFLVYPGDDYANVDGSLYGASCKVFNFTGRNGPVAAEQCVSAAKGTTSGPVPVVAFGGNGMNMYDTVESVLDFLPKDQQWEAKG